VAKRGRSTEGEEAAPSPSSADAAVAPRENIGKMLRGHPDLKGFGISDQVVKGKWVAFEVRATGEVKLLTPVRSNGVLEGEGKPSAAARLMAAVTKEYR
jgi:hypothetical protein